MPTDTAASILTFDQHSSVPLNYDITACMVVTISCTLQ